MTTTIDIEQDTTHPQPCPRATGERICGMTGTTTCPADGHPDCPTC